MKKAELLLSLSTILIIIQYGNTQISEPVDVKYQIEIWAQYDNIRHCRLVLDN